MINLQVPDLPEEAHDEQRPVLSEAPQSEGARLAQRVMAVDLADHASRAQARRTVERLAGKMPSDVKCRMYDRRIRLLALADAGNAKVADDMARLMTELRKLSPTEGRGFLGKLFDSPEKRLERILAARADIETIVASLARAAETLRQNDVALDGFEADMRSEAQQIAADIELADDFEEALVAGLARAQATPGMANVASFAQMEVLSPLEQQRQYLQSLRAVNQQMALSLAILRENNAALIQNVRYVTVAAKHALETAVMVRRSQKILDTLKGAQKEPSSPGAQDPSAAPSMADLDESLGELSRTLEGHEAWRKQASARKADALTELEDLSARAFGEGD